MLEALTQTITITKADGTNRTIEVHEAFTKSIVHDSLKAPLLQKLKALAAMHKFGIAEVLSARAKIDADRAELEAERREFEKSQDFARKLAELSRDYHAQLKAEWYAAASVVSEVCDHVEWGEGTERLKERANIIARAFERDRESDAQIDEIMKEMRARFQSDDGDDEAWEEDEDSDEDDLDDRDLDRYRDGAAVHDASTDGGVEYVAGEYDESALPDTGDPDDPALDLANGQIGPEDLVPPTGEDDGEY
jgi:hypothetical protein